MAKPQIPQANLEQKKLLNIDFILVGITIVLFLFSGHKLFFDNFSSFSNNRVLVATVHEQMHTVKKKSTILKTVLSLSVMLTAYWLINI